MEISIETVTLGSHVVSVMAVSWKTDNSEGQIQILYDSVRKQGDSLLVILFLAKEMFRKRGHCGHRRAT